MSYLGILFIILLYTLQSFLCKKYTDAYPGKEELASPVFTIVSGFSIALLTFAVSGFHVRFDGVTVLLGICNALALFIYNYAIVKCAQSGPYSVLTVFNLGGGIIIPVVLAALFFSQPVSPGKILSILVIIPGMWMISKKKAEGNDRPTVKFIGYCLLLGSANGLYGTLLNVQQRITGEENKQLMVICTFFFAALLSTVLLFAGHPSDAKGAFRQSRVSLIFLIACSLVAGGAINMLTYLLTFVDLTLLYTFDNAGVLLLSVLFARIFFKEKMSALNAAGCAVMALGLIGVSVF